jgi:uncharacterized phage-associated protein
VYLAHGLNLTFFGSPLIREKVEAGRYGPIISSLYSKFLQMRVPLIEDEMNVPSGATDLDEKARDVISVTWTKYGHLSGLQLAMLTHEPGNAWDTVRRGNAVGLSSPVIPDSFIRNEFEKRIAVGANG